MRRLLAVALLAVALLEMLAAPWGRAGAQELVADLSHHLIQIDSEFSGADLLVFGAVDSPGDIIIVVRGPRSPVVVRQKERVFGIWMNARSVAFDNVPAFYALASSRPIEDILGTDMLRLNEIGLSHLRITPEADAEPQTVATFEEALLAQKQRRGLFPAEPDKVSFLGSRLFRAVIHFPAAVPVGRYTVDVVLVRDGQVVVSFSPPLTVEKAGFGADVFDFAHQSSALYGLLAIFGAGMAGFAGSLLFRRP